MESHKCVRQIHDTPHIPDDAARCQRTECNDLSHTVFSVFSYYIVDDLTAVSHSRNPRRYQAWRLAPDLRNAQTADYTGSGQCCVMPSRIGDDTSRRASHAPVRPGCHVSLRIADKIPHDQKIIDVSHLLDNVVSSYSRLRASAPHGVLTDNAPSVLRNTACSDIPRMSYGDPAHRKRGQLRHAKLNVHMAPLLRSSGYFQLPAAHREKAAPSPPVTSR